VALELNRFMNIFLSTWTLLVAGLIFALPMIHLRVKNHTDLEDETLYVNIHFASFALYNYPCAWTCSDVLDYL
jgi:hypothetical protein